MILEQNIKLKQALQESVALIRQRLPYHDYNKVQEWEQLSEQYQHKSFSYKDVWNIVMSVWIDDPNIEEFFEQNKLEKNIETLSAISKRRNRVQPFTFVRYSFFYYATLIIDNYTLKSLGHFMGGRDHSTVIHGKNTWEDLIRFEKDFKDKDKIFKRIFGL